MTSLASIVLVFKMFPFLKTLKHTFAEEIEVKGELSKLKPAEKIKRFWLIMKDQSVATQTCKDGSLLGCLRGETHLGFLNCSSKTFECTICLRHLALNADHLTA